MGSRWGIEKLREDWGHPFPVLGWPGFGLLVDGLGHLAIGFAFAAAPMALGGQTALGALIGLAAGAMREGIQYGGDDDPHLNLLDRLKDCAEFALGGAIAGWVLC